MLPNAPTPEAERPVLHRWLAEQSGPMAYRYLPQYMSGIDPRAQTEDMGDDPVRAGEYAMANLHRVVPNLVAWTTQPGEDYTDLDELYGEAVSMWSRYMGHVVSVIGGVSMDQKTAEQAGAVYAPVPRARQEAALRFLREQVIETPEWLVPDAIVSRIGPQGAVASAQAGVVGQLLDTRRLGRLAAVQAMAPDRAYPVADYLADVRRALWGAAAPDASQRALQRVYLDRLGAIVAPPPPPSGPAAGGRQGGDPPSPLLAPVNVQRSDLPALARSELRAVRATAAQRAASAPAGVVRAHWQDVVSRVDATLEADRAR